MMVGATVGAFVAILPTCLVHFPLLGTILAADTRARTQTKAGWLRLSGSDATKAVERLAAAHSQLQETVGANNVLISWSVAAALCWALVDTGRGAEAAAVQAVLAEARQRNKGNAGCRGKGKSWKIHGPYLAAGLAVAARAPDAEVLALLHEAAAAIVDSGCDARDVWGSMPTVLLGSHAVFYADGQPEWTLFLARMQGGGSDVTIEDREAWAAMGEEMTGRFAKNWRGLSDEGTLVREFGRRGDPMRDENGRIVHGFSGAPRGR